MKQMILKIDESADFSEMPDSLKEAIKKANIQWPQGQMIGTHPYYSKRLVLIMTSLDKDTLTEWLGGQYPTIDENGEPTIVDFGLNWEILAVEGEKIDQAPILKFIDDKIMEFEDGETYSEVVTDITGKLQTFAGHSWTYA